MRATKFAFCAKCNQERPTFKDYLRAPENKKISRCKVTMCAVCRDRVFVANKYGAIKTKSLLTNRTFDSKKEARREPALVAMENVGVIHGLRYQVPYRLDVYSVHAVDRLIDFLERPDTFDSPLDRAHTQALIKEIRRSRQKICNYIADFVYTDENGNEVVEDVKGRATAIYRMKKKLMVACHDVEIVEPGDTGVQQRARGAGVRGAHTGSRFKGGG